MIKKHVSLALLLLGGLVLFFGVTDPENVPVGFLIVPILIFFIVFLLTSSVFIKIFRPNISKNRQRNLSVLVGLVLSLLLLFYSAGGIVLGDLILIVLIFFIGLLYINKY